MKTIKFIFLACLLILGSNIYGQDTWTSFTSSTPQQVEENLIISNNTSVQFNVEIFGMYEKDVTANGIDFQRINIPGAIQSVSIGQPEMPYIRNLIAIPHCDDVTMSVNITGTTSFTNYNIYPAPELVEVTNPDGSLSVEESFVYNAAAYQQNLNYPQVNAEIVSTGYLRDQMYAEVHIYPVQFNPVTGILQIGTNYEITLSFANPGGPVNENTGIFNNVASNVFMNYASSGMTAKVNDRPGHTGNIEWITLTDTAQASNIVADYLIITDTIFWDPSGQTTDLLKIAQHRAEYNGFDIAIAKVEEVMSVFYDPSYLEYPYEKSIRAFISAIYEGENANNTYDGKLGYILLVGKPYIDLPVGIPASYDQNPGACFDDEMPSSAYPSDYYYSCLTSTNDTFDDVGDLFVGRFSVSNIDQLHNIIEKTVSHETEFDPEVFEGSDSVFFVNSGFSNATEYLASYHPWLETIINPPYGIKIFNSLIHNNYQCLDDLIDTINTGVNAMFYFGHSDKNNYSISNGQHFLTTDYLTQNLSNKGKYPFVANHSCNSGMYDGHYGQCLAEALTSYSDTSGYLACLASGRLLWLNKGSLPNFPSAIQEVMPISVWQHQSHILGEFILESKVTSASIKDNFALNLFGDPATNLMADGFEITSNCTLQCPATISSEISVRAGGQLFVPQNCNLEFVDKGKLIIDYGGTLVLSAGSTINGMNPQNAIDVYGNLLFSYVNAPITFTAPEGHTWRGLSIKNHNYIQTIYQTLIFENCDFDAAASEIIFEPTNWRNRFENSNFQYSNGSLKILNSDFINSSVLALDPANHESSVEIGHCTFANDDNVFLSSIFIERYKQYYIHENEINFSDGDGITIFNCGGLLAEYNFPNGIFDNTLQFTGTSPDLHKGIKIYKSIADIRNNKIYDADYGIVGLNNSIINILGTDSASSPSETQIVSDNQSYQMYFSNNSFPNDLMYNIIDNGDNPNPLIYNDAVPPIGHLLNVELNCWDSYFSAQTDLIPAGYYDWEPVWCPATTISVTSSEDEMLYESALQNVAYESYGLAETEFKQIISGYPETETAKNALKQLFELESISGQDYLALRNYFDSEANLQNNNALGKLAAWMISYCDVKLEEYQLAIEWYDALIDTTTSEADSTFAAIDMGEAALAAGNGNKDMVSCKHVQFIFDTRKAFELNRDFLIDELLKSGKTNEQEDHENIGNDQFRIAHLNQNVPNPFTSTTSIIVELYEACFMELELLDMHGNKVVTLAKGKFEEDAYTFILNNSSLHEGVYFYSLTINGIKLDTKKMVLLK
jgi:hypothetical protein